LKSKQRGFATAHGNTGRPLLQAEFALEPLFQENDPDVWSPFALLVAQLAYDGKTAQSWRTVSSDLAKANEKHNQRAGN